MKNTFIYIALINIFTFDSFAQKTTTSSYANNTEVNQKERISLIKGNSAPLGSIDYYLVEEKINQKFGGYIRTYKVSNYNLIDCYDIVPNNTRTITPYYETIEEKKESKSTSIKLHFPALQNL